MACRLTIRAGARVERERHRGLGDALAALEARADELAGSAPAHAMGGRALRRFEPVQQVIGRIELRGDDGVRGGVDVRGDGSVEAFTGRMRRTLVDQRPGESPYEALARALAL